jgi:hypothetical protein
VFLTFGTFCTECICTECGHSVKMAITVMLDCRCIFCAKCNCVPSVLKTLGTMQPMLSVKLSLWMKFSRSNIYRV